MNKDRKRIRSCANCRNKHNEEQMIVLAEWELGLSPIDNYIVCGECYEKM